MLFIAVLFILTTFYTILGFIASKKVQSSADYFLAGRDLGLFPVTATLIATQIGGAMLLGTSENAYLYGLYGLLYTIGMIGGFIALGCGIASRLQSLQVATTAAIFEKKYRSITLKKIASLLSILTLCGILIGQIVGSRSIIENIKISTGNELIFICFWLLVIIYTMVGGLKAVVITDIFQVLLIIAVFIGIFIYSLLFGPAIAWKEVMNIQSSYFGSVPLNLNIILATLVMPALFSLIEQDLAQRFFAARNKKIATISAFLSGLFMICFALVPIYFGMVAKIIGLPIAIGKSPLIPIIEYLTNDFVVVLSLCAIIAAITSTADSLLCAISSNIAQDFTSADTTPLSLARSQWITLIAGISALIGSYIVPQNVIEIMIDSYAISVNCLLVPLLWAYFSKTVSKRAAYSSIITGLMGMMIVPFIPETLPKAILPLCFSTIGYVIAYYIPDKIDK